MKQFLIRLSAGLLVLFWLFIQITTFVIAFVVAQIVVVFKCCYWLITTKERISSKHFPDKYDVKELLTLWINVYGEYSDFDSL